jgi:CheY-like chemotaxis protein
MRDRTLHHVALCGFSSSERDLLETLFSTTSAQPRAFRYRAWDSVSGEPPDLALIDDQSGGWVQWQRLQRRFPTHEIVTLVVGHNCDEASRVSFIQKPIVPSRIASALDGLALEGLPGEPRSFDPMLHLDPPDVDSADYAGRRVLVVDDSEAAREHLEQQLGAYGLRCDFAVDPTEALYKLRRQPYHLVLLDIVLPEIDGFALCREIKRDICAACPVVLMTSRGSRMDRLRASFAAADGYLNKPLTRKALEETLARHLPQEAVA